MSIPLQGYPRSAAVSPRLQVTESTGSTNADLVKAAAKGEVPPPRDKSAAAVKAAKAAAPVTWADAIAALVAATDAVKAVKGEPTATELGELKRLATNLRNAMGAHKIGA